MNTKAGITKGDERHCSHRRITRESEYLGVMTCFAIFVAPNFVILGIFVAQELRVLGG